MFRMLTSTTDRLCPAQDSKDHPQSYLRTLLRVVGVHPNPCSSWSNLIRIAGLLTMVGIWCWMMGLLLSSLLHADLAVNGSSDHHQGWKFAVVIDAGSTGSRVHVYKYRNPKDPSSTATALVRTDSLSKELMDIDFRNEKYEKFKPGLSSFEDIKESQQLRSQMIEYMKPLLQFARDHTRLEHEDGGVRSSSSSDERIPVFVLATAGMRKVREHDDDQAERIMQAVFEVVDSQTEEFVTRKEWIRIIEGTDEGLWGWVTANYLNGALQSNGKKPTMGVLEMGGESLQITFTPEVKGLDNSKLHKLNDQVKLVTIAGKKHYIFTHSYMGVGMEAAQLKFDEHLLFKKKAAENMNVRNVDYDQSPCYLHGTQRQYHDPNPKEGDSSTISFEGTGHFQECLKELSWVLDQTKVCRREVSESKELSKELHSPHKYQELIMRKTQNERCTPNGIFMPDIIPGKHHFYYIENFYYTANVLNIDDVSGDQFLAELHRKGEEFCHLSPEKARSKYPNAREDEIQKTCFCAAWLVAMLETGFRLESFKDYRVIRDINSVGIDWALGFLVLNSDEIVYTLQSLKQQSGSLLSYFSQNGQKQAGMVNDDSEVNSGSSDYTSSMWILVVIIAVCGCAFAYYHNFDRRKMLSNTQYYYHRLSQGTSKKRETELA